jgi:hypothetical protein
LEKDYRGERGIKTININLNNDEKFEFEWGNEKRNISQFGPPQTYLYEPNAAILKSGAFKTIGNSYRLKKLHAHSHLYTSENLVVFPGRSFIIEKTIPYNKKALQHLGIKKANISTRNFPESVANIRKKHKIKDGGDIFLFFTTNHDGNLCVLQCSKNK